MILDMPIEAQPENPFGDEYMYLMSTLCFLAPMLSDILTYHEIDSLRTETESFAHIFAKKADILALKEVTGMEWLLRIDVEQHIVTGI